MAKAKDSKRKRAIRRLKHKFRLVILNDETFKEEFSIILSPLNVFTWGGLAIILLAGLIVVSIAFTPLRELIPGYADVGTRRMATYAALKADSMQERLGQYEQYLDNLKAIMKNEVRNEDTSLQSNLKVSIDSIEYKPSAQDSALRNEVENNEAYNINLAESEGKSSSLSAALFFPPLNGVVSSSFDPSVAHYGVDIVPPNNDEVVKAVLPGRVILSTWSSETGNIVQIQHSGDLISVYKHNAVLLKSTGDRVEAGEAIAIVGNSGELSSGPHLHFELWHRGEAVDPENYVAF